MNYIPEWESLSDAVVRLAKSGIAQSEARQQIAAAIADRAIRIQVWVTEILTSQPWSGEVRIPPELTEADFDWAQSRPLHRWWFPEKFNPGFSKPKRVDRLRVSTRDLITVFGLEGSANASQNHSSDPENVSAPEQPVQERASKSEQAQPSDLGNRETPDTRVSRKAWNIADERHFDAMKTLLDGGKALSVADAARQVVESGTVIGHGTEESLRKRLERGYREYAKSAR
jgi:hypothetical protein